MTWVTDNTGTRWIEYEPRKRRTSPRAVRFSDLKVGDQLMRLRKDWDDRMRAAYYIVTDLWFDPVAGQRDETAGRMVAIRSLDDNGLERKRKEPHTLRGLASQGFHYADVDYIALKVAEKAAQEVGAVVGIGYASVIRKRPKLPGARF